MGDVDRVSVFGDSYEPVSQDCFDASYEEDWFNDDVVKQIIKDIDNTEVVGWQMMMSPVLGPIPPERLSTGAKTLIMLHKFDDFITSGERLGDNCWNWVFKLSKDKDIILPLNHTIPIQSLPEKVECVIVNDENRHLIGTPIDFFDEWLAMRFIELFKLRVKNGTLDEMFPFGIDVTPDEYVDRFFRERKAGNYAPGTY